MIGFLLAALSVSAVAQIEARWGWMGVPGNIETYDAIIRPRGDQFESTSTYHLSIYSNKNNEGSTDLHKVDEDRTTTIPAKRVRQLLEAIAHPIRSAPVAADFGATQSWLNANAERAFGEFLFPGGGATGGFYSEAQRSLYVGSFTNPDTVSAMLLHYYSQSPWIDDFVYVTVDVRFKSWQHLKIESRQPETLMLPWAVSGRGRTYRTFSPELSAAIARLLPIDAVRYDRLSARSLSHQLPNLFGDYIKPQWEKVPGFDVRRLIAPLEKKYNVQIGGPDCCGDNVKPVWGAQLKWPDLSPAIIGLVDLPVVNNAFPDTSGIPAARRFADQTYAVPWLRRFLDAHPKVFVKVLLERGGSMYLDQGQQRDLLDDLRAVRRAPAQQTEQDFRSAFIVSIDEEDKYRFSDWVVLPDSTMLLWTYFDPGKTGSILDLASSAIAGKACARTTPLSCSGLIRNPDGSFVN